MLFLSIARRVESCAVALHSSVFTTLIQSLVAYPARSYEANSLTRDDLTQVCFQWHLKKLTRQSNRLTVEMADINKSAFFPPFPNIRVYAALTSNREHWIEVRTTAFLALSHSVILRVRPDTKTPLVIGSIHSKWRPSTPSGLEPPTLCMYDHGLNATTS